MKYLIILMALFISSCDFTPAKENNPKKITTRAMVESLDTFQVYYPDSTTTVMYLLKDNLVVYEVAVVSNTDISIHYFEVFLLCLVIVCIVLLVVALSAPD